MSTAEFDDAQLLRGALDIAVLAVIAVGETYGYDIARRIWDTGLAEVREASVYGTVNRLFRAGLLSARVEASPSGPHRKYYGLTADGVAYFASGRDAWARTRTSLDGLLAAADTSQPSGGRHPR